MVKLIPIYTILIVLLQFNIQKIIISASCIEFFLIISHCFVFHHSPGRQSDPGPGSSPITGPGPNHFFLVQALVLIPSYFWSQPWSWSRSCHISGPCLGPGLGLVIFPVPALIPVQVQSYFWSRPWSRSSLCIEHCFFSIVFFINMIY